MQVLEFYEIDTGSPNKIGIFIKSDSGYYYIYDDIDRHISQNILFKEACAKIKVGEEFNLFDYPIIRYWITTQEEYESQKKFQKVENEINN
jgi:hypothetical protein